MDGFICVLTCHLGRIYRVGRVERRSSLGVGLDPPPGMGLWGAWAMAELRERTEQGEKVSSPSQICIFTSAVTLGFNLFLPVKR